MFFNVPFSTNESECLLVLIKLCLNGRIFSPLLCCIVLNKWILSLKAVIHAV